MAKAEYSIRRGNERDIPSLTKLRWQVVKKGFNDGVFPVNEVGPRAVSYGLDQIDDDFGRCESQLYIADTLGEKKMILVAELDKKPIGVAHLEFYPEDFLPHVLLDSISIGSEHSGLGIALHLIRSTIQTTRELYPVIQTLKGSRYTTTRKRDKASHSLFSLLGKIPGVEVNDCEIWGYPGTEYTVNFSIVERVLYNLDTVKKLARHNS